MNIATCVSIDLTHVPQINQVLQWTTAPMDLVFSGNNYQSVGALLKIGKVSVENSVKGSPLEIVLTGLDTSVLNLMLNVDIGNPNVTIWRVFFGDNSNVVTSYEMYYKGKGSTPEQAVTYPKDDKPGFVTLGMQCYSVFNLDAKQNLLTCNNQTHQAYFPGDLFYTFANIDQNDDPTMWKR